MVYESVEVRDPSFVIADSGVVKKLIFTKSDGDFFEVDLANVGSGAGYVLRDAPSTVTAAVSFKSTSDSAARIIVDSANGKILGGLGTAAPTIEFKPTANGTGWEINKGFLKLRADTVSSVAPELHFHALRGAGNDGLAWGIGIDVANVKNQGQDFAFFKGIGGSVSDELYANGRRALSSTWAIGMAPANDHYKFTIVSSIAGGSTTIAAGSNGVSLPQATVNVASTSGFATSGLVLIATANGPQSVWYTGVTGTSFTGCTGGTGAMTTGGAVGDVNMGGLRIQTASTTVGKAFVITDGAAIDRVWFDGDGTLRGNHGLAGASVCIQADPTNNRALSMRDNAGANYYSFYYTAGNLKLRGVSAGLDVFMASASANLFHIYLPFTAGNNAIVCSAPTQTLGFFGATGIARQTLPAAATDAATTQTLVNSIRTMLLAHGMAV